MKQVAFIFLSFVFLSCTNSTGNSNTSNENSKTDIAQKEKQKPLEFLHARGTYRTNMIGQWVLEGNIRNSATIATYKDVVFRIYYYSKTKTELGTEEKTVFEYFKPESDNNFKVKTNGFEGTSTIAFEIVSAGVQ